VIQHFGKHGYLVSINAINVVHRNLILDGTERWMYYRIREDFSHILSLERTGDAARKAFEVVR
ncbi:MAG: hypothetical protein MUO43_14135, partial [Desulfobacterales bacterium]|nr:hypothetical protein [Desulfobacterales bacterium]